MRSVYLTAYLFAVALATAPQTRADGFTKHPKWFQVGPNPCAIVAEDLNGDGIPEIVTADRGSMTSPREERPANDELSLLESRGVLVYEAKPPLRAGFAPYAVVAANIDALKATDLVVGSFHDPRRRHLTLFRNLGENGFETLTFAVPETGLRYQRLRDNDGEPIYTVPGITSLAVREINRDEFRDVIATGWSSDVLIFFPGERAAYFGQPAIIPAPGGPRDVQIADLNSDGSVDLATSMYNSGEIVIWKGDGTGAFAEANRFSSRSPLPHKVRIADMNGDGRLDIAVSHCFTSDSVVIFFGDAEPAFSFSTSQEIAMHPNDNRQSVDDEIRDLLVRDFNGDGRIDFATACYASRRVCVFLNESNGPAIPLRFRRETYTFKDARPRALAAADFNADGEDDLAVTLWEANAVALLLAN
jgi:hypothetical protein